MADTATTDLARKKAIEKALDEAPLTKNTWKTWFLAAMGVFLDGFDLFVMGVAIPLIAQDFDMGPGWKSLIGGAAVFGAVLGAWTLGRMADQLGRARLFKIDLILFIVFAVASGLAWDLWSLFIFRFFLGVAIGAEYPLSSSVVSEVVPARLRGRMLVSSFSFQALGALTGAIVGLLILVIVDGEGAWRWLLMVGIIPAIVVALLRRVVPESARWLANQGRLDEAEESAAWMLGTDVPPLSEEEIAKLDPAREPRAEKVPYSELFRPRWLRRTVFTAAPWFLMDIATYGVGMFTPTILSAIIVTGANTNFIADDIASTEGTALVDLFLVLGFALAILLIEKVGRVKLQSVGFAGMAIGMAVLGWANVLPGGGDDHLWMVFLGFFVFNTLMNMGPNSTTFLLPAEVFPTRMRATGHGFAAGCGKVGASIGIVILPYVQDDLGVTGVAFLMSGVAALGLIITLIFQVETTGKSLEDLDLYEPDKPSELAPAIE